MQIGEASRLIRLLTPIENILRQLQQAAPFLSSDHQNRVNALLDLIQRRKDRALEVETLEGRLVAAQRNLVVDGFFTLPRQSIVEVVRDALFSINQQVSSTLQNVQLFDEPARFVGREITKAQYEAFK